MARRKTRRNAWRGSKRRHATAARKGWRKRRRRKSSVGATKRSRAARRGWRKRRSAVAAAPRRRKRRRNPLYRKQDGEYTGHRTKRRLHRKRKRGGGYSRGWRNNPRKKRRRRRTARQNPYHYNRRRYSLRRNPLEAIMDQVKEAFSTETLEQVFHGALGFGGTVAGTKAIAELSGWEPLQTGVGKVVLTGGVAILGSAVVGVVLKDKKLATRMMVGGLLATGLRILGEVLPSEVKEYVPTLGDNESMEFRRAIEAEVLRELGGGMSHIPAAGSEAYIPAAGSEAYMTPLEADEAQMGMGAYLTSAEALRAEDRGAGMGLYPFETSEIGRAGQVEKF